MMSAPFPPPSPETSACASCGSALAGNSAAQFCPACALAAFDAATGEDGFHIPGYENLLKLSRGGMGVVYQARQINPDRLVAVKVLLTHLADDAEMQARFHIEARAMAALDHPAILPVYEVGQVDGMPFFSMKLARGGTLGQKLASGPLPPREACTLMAGLSRALHYSHQQGVLHRDIKPGNFLFDDDGRIYLTDFGLAKIAQTTPGDALTRTESFFGTPHYMPPEIAGGSVTQAGTPADIYSMGAVLYQCLSGKRPYGEKENIAALLNTITSESPPPLRTVSSNLPRDLEVICSRAMERSPAARYASAADLADDLERWLAGRPINARPVGSAERCWRWARRHPLPAGLAAALLLTAGIGGAFLFSSNQERGKLLTVANQRLSRSLIDQARAQRLLGAPGHRHRSLNLLRQAAEILPSSEIRDEAAALLVRPDLRAVPAQIDPRTLNTSAFARTLDHDDTTARHLVSPDSTWCLSLYEKSGRAAAWRRSGTTPVAIWNPPPGHAITGGILPDGTGAILADTEQGLLSFTVSNLTSRVLLPPGSSPITAMALDPSGRIAALGMADGLAVVNLADAGTLWKIDTPPTLCTPVWNPDSTLLAAASSQQRGVAIYKSTSGTRELFIPTTGWPVALALHPLGHLIAVASDDHLITLAETSTGKIWATIPSASQKVMFSQSSSHLESGDNAWLLENPVGLREFKAMPSTSKNETVFALALTPNGRHLLTTATSGVCIWSTTSLRQTGFHAAENQLIDAPTAAWWLDDQHILVQIPGGLERLTIDQNGIPTKTERVPRPPGSTVIRVELSGAWIVQVVDEEENHTFESWPSGNSALATAIPPPVPPQSLTNSVTSNADASITLTQGKESLRLTLPEPAPPIGTVLTPDGNHLYYLTARHQLFDWDLKSLKAILAAEGFPGN